MFCGGCSRRCAQHVTDCEENMDHVKIIIMLVKTLFSCFWDVIILTLDVNLTGFLANVLGMYTRFAGSHSS
jgi:hypothetical protein